MRLKSLEEFKEDILKLLDNAVRNFETADDVPVGKIKEFIHLAMDHIEDAKSEVIVLLEVAAKVMKDLHDEVKNLEENCEDLEAEIGSLEDRLEYYEE